MTDYFRSTATSIESDPHRATSSSSNPGEASDSSADEAQVAVVEAAGSRECCDPTHLESGEGMGWTALLGETLQVVVPALILALFVHFFLAQATVVFGQSMEPNLLQHQRLVVDKVSYRLHPPQRGDIVVLDLPDMDEMLVKRVVGLPGESVEVRNGIVYINGIEVLESFPHDLSAYDMPIMTLPPLHYFVLGDNRGNSNDSRSFGSIHRDYIVGRVWLRYWPVNQFTLF